jgi:catechol 2,3-dioxygenase-like lactoylglutathione lyase family enzyme
MILSTDHVAIIVKDFDKTREWYAKNLGFTFGRKKFLSAGDSQVEIFIQSDAEKAKLDNALKAGEIGLTHICFVVDGFDEMVEKLRKEGIEVDTTPRRGRKHAEFKDPNGVILQFIE